MPWEWTLTPFLCKNCAKFHLGSLPPIKCPSYTCGWDAEGGGHHSEEQGVNPDLLLFILEVNNKISASNSLPCGCQSFFFP